MLTLDGYRRDPCGTSSLPWWKIDVYPMPAGMFEVHERDLARFGRPTASSAVATDGGTLPGIASDGVYFRLIHPLIDVPSPQLLEGFSFCDVDTSDDAELTHVAQMIQACYESTDVTVDKVRSWLTRPVFDPELWVWMIDDARTRVGLVIGEIDATVPEAALEWLQVLPQTRGRGVGKALVAEFVRRCVGKADFATVSGEVDNPHDPEGVYRACGFVGNDRWHILRIG